jgi:predicted Zn-dependent protease
MCAFERKIRKFARNLEMEATVATLVTVFGFDPALAQRAVDSIQDKDDVQLAWNWILDHGGEDQGGPVIPTQM